MTWGVLQLLGGDDDPEDKVVTPTAKPSAVEPTVAPVNGKVDVNLSTGTGACDPEKVRVSPAVKPGQFSGQPVNVTMTVSTTGKDDCILNAKSADLLVVISANKKPIWDSSVCKAALLTKPVAVSARWATVVETTWSGRGSGPNCSPREGYTGSGTYVIKSATLGGEPGQATFKLVKKPKPKPTPTKATPNPTKTTATAKPSD